MQKEDLDCQGTFIPEPFPETLPPTKEEEAEKAKLVDVPAAAAGIPATSSSSSCLSSHVSNEFIKAVKIFLRKGDDYGTLVGSNINRFANKMVALSREQVSMGISSHKMTYTDVMDTLSSLCLGADAMLKKIEEGQLPKHSRVSIGFQATEATLRSIIEEEEAEAQIEHDKFKALKENVKGKLMLSVCLGPPILPWQRPNASSMVCTSSSTDTKLNIVAQSSSSSSSTSSTSFFSSVNPEYRWVPRSPALKFGRLCSTICKNNRHFCSVMQPLFKDGARFDNSLWIAALEGLVEDGSVAILTPEQEIITNVAVHFNTLITFARISTDDYGEGGRKINIDCLSLAPELLAPLEPAANTISERVAAEVAKEVFDQLSNLSVPWKEQTELLLSATTIVANRQEGYPGKITHTDIQDWSESFIASMGEIERREEKVMRNKCGSKSQDSKTMIASKATLEILKKRQLETQNRIHFQRMVLPPQAHLQQPWHQQPMQPLIPVFQAQFIEYAYLPQMYSMSPIAGMPPIVGHIPVPSWPQQSRFGIVPYPAGALPGSSHIPGNSCFTNGTSEKRARSDDANISTGNDAKRAKDTIENSKFRSM